MPTPTLTLRSRVLHTPAGPSRKRRYLTLALIASGLAGAMAGGQPRFSSGRGYAAPASPPPPPTYLPTPIGGPPLHPTDTPVATGTGTPATPVGATSTATPGKSPTAVAAVGFSLDAARVAPVNNAGDLSGLAAVRAGSTVWLMMYLTIKTESPAASADSTYEIYKGATSILRASYVWKTKARQTGRFSRYMEYRIPAGLPLGQHLVLKTTLRIGKQSQTRTWTFVVAKQQRIATTSRARR